MEIKNFTITKRDGTKERFSLDKIMNAIVKAFESVNEPTDLGTVSKVLADLDIHNDIKVEDIQNQVEEALMKEGYYNVAKSFIVYRQQHTEDREVLEKMRFLTDYCKAENAATGSKFDANANVEQRTSQHSSASCPSKASSDSTAVCSPTASRRCMAKISPTNTSTC